MTMNETVIPINHNTRTVAKLNCSVIKKHTPNKIIHKHFSRKELKDWNSIFLSAAKYEERMIIRVIMKKITRDILNSNIYSSIFKRCNIHICTDWRDNTIIVNNKMIVSKKIMENRAVTFFLYSIPGNFVGIKTFNPNTKVKLRVPIPATNKE